VPAADLDDWLAGRPPLVREVLDRVAAALGSYDDVVFEATKAAVMVKRSRTFAEVKPRRASVELGFIVSRHIDDARIAGTFDLTKKRIVHRVELTDGADIDDQLREWLTEAYQASPQ
jgi:hypothetical protein